ncbi:MAG: tRNA lysidine(34) synthetase TilS [Gammaproteobacteria bacterium]
MTFSPDAVGAVLDRYPGTRFCVAFSGGLDSTVLLHALASLRNERGFALRAVHVDHGLHADSARWAEHCIHEAAALSVPCVAVRVTVDPAADCGPEAAARDARYAALAAEVGADEAMLTAQHADDQAETVLLALLRGSGPAGLAAMPECAPLGAGLLMRPLLCITRDALDAWARAQKLTWVEDPSNQHTGYARNYLRRNVTPALREYWPGFARALGRSAQHAADADALLDALAADDLSACALGDALDATAVTARSDARARNLLRHWIAARDLPTPPYERLVEALRQIRAAAPDRVPAVDWPGAVLRRWDGRLFVDTDEPIGPPEWELAPAKAGLSAERLAKAALTVRHRTGGETLRIHPGGPHRPLKLLFAEAGVPPWQRDHVPLLFADDALVAVGKLFSSADWQAAEGEPAVTFRYHCFPSCRGASCGT